MNLNVRYRKNLAEQIVVTNSGWFKKWFDSSCYHQLYAHRNEKEAADFIDALVDQLQPTSNARMLDLGCGAGRHAKYLASKGYNVTGLDLAASSIRMARKFENEALQFYQHDMRVPFGKQYVDYVFSFFTSFGYFESDVENHTVIENIANALKPGGMLMMDYLNVPFSEAHMIPNEEKEIDGIIYHITRSWDEKHFFKKIVVDNIQTAGPVQYTEKVAKLYLEDFTALFEAHGLELQHVYGDYGLNDHNLNTSPRLIMLARKK